MAHVPNRPLLSGLYHVVPLPPDRVQVCNAGRSVVLTGPAFAERLPPVLAALDGTATVEQLIDLYPELAPALLEGLASRGLLLDDGGAGDNGRTARQTATALPGATAVADTAARLRSATVAFAGGGQVALSAALFLAQAGVGRLLIDAIESEANADIVVAEQRFSDSGMYPPAADAALVAGVPYVIHGQDALVATVGPVVQPGGRPCHRCAEARRQANIAHIDEHVAYLAHRETHAPAPDSFLAAHTAVVAGHLANDVLRALLGLAPIDASVLVIDLATGAAQRQPVLALPGCEGCAGARE